MVQALSIGIHTSHTVVSLVIMLTSEHMWVRARMGWTHRLRYELWLAGQFVVVVLRYLVQYIRCRRLLEALSRRGVELVLYGVTVLYVWLVGLHLDNVAIQVG